jgi:hypothetical protein
MTIGQKLRRKFRIFRAFCYGFVKIGMIGIIPGALVAVYFRLGLGPDYENLLASEIFAVVSGFILFGIFGAFFAAQDCSDKFDELDRRKKEQQDTILIADTMESLVIKRFIEQYREKLGGGYEGFRLYSRKLVEIDDSGDAAATYEFIAKVKPLLDPYYAADKASHDRLENTLKSCRPK